jgi:hypothetical protein
VEKALCHRFLSREKRVHSLANGNDLSRPLMAWDYGIMIKACWPGASIKLYIAATDAYCA